MDPDELLYTNAFQPETPNNTYGVQKQLRRHALKQHINKEFVVLDDPNENDILEDDLMKTNPSIKADLVQEARLEKSRYIKEIVTFYNIDSRNRKDFIEVLVPKDPNTRQYTRECIHPETGEYLIECYTADDLNLEYQCDQHSAGNFEGIIDPFFERNGEIFYKKSCGQDASCYEIQFPKVLTNVKAIRMVSSEIPNPMRTINNWNNLILIDIKDENTQLSHEEKCLGFSESIPLKEDCLGLPFFLIQIPQGNYNFEDLLEKIERVVNKNIERKSKDEYKNLFKITGNVSTGKVEIRICSPKEKNLSFHWRFWFAPGIPESNLLYWMLGFARPFERNLDGTNKYVTVWNNLFNFGPKFAQLKNINVNKNAQGASAHNLTNLLVHEGFNQIRPFRPINLQPAPYIFLILEGIGNLTDFRLPSTQIFAKIQLPVPPGETAFNTFINSPNFFVDVPLRFLEKLIIKWVDAEGNLIDWHGLEHSFTLEISQYLDRLTVNDYSSIRGVTDPTSFTSKERIFAYTQ